MANFAITAFNNGEVSPQIDCRSDIEKYAGSCRALENMIPLVYGDVTRRPGTRFIKPAFAPINQTIVPDILALTAVILEPTLIYESHTEFPDALALTLTLHPPTIDEGKPDWPGGFLNGVNYDQCPPDIHLEISGMSLCDCFCDSGSGSGCYSGGSTLWHKWFSPTITFSEDVPLSSGTYGDCLYEGTFPGSGIRRVYFNQADQCNDTFGHLDFVYDEVSVYVRVLGHVVIVRMKLLDTTLFTATGFFFGGTGNLITDEAVSVSNNWDDCLSSALVSGEWVNSVVGGTAVVS